jgi:hypothetical protein
MARVPITVMGFRCERCSHEWIPRGGLEDEPRICPKCKSPYWSRPRKAMMTYDDFKGKIVSVLTAANKPLTWTEIRTAATLPQAFPNNQWVHRMEKDIGLIRRRESDGTIHWQLKEATLDLVDHASAEAPDQNRRSARGK